MSYLGLEPLNSPELIAESTREFTYTALLLWFNALGPDYKLSDTSATFRDVDELPPYNLHFHKNAQGREYGISAFFRPLDVSVDTVHITARQIPGDASNNHELRDIEPLPIEALHWKKHGSERLDLIKLYVKGRGTPRPHFTGVPLAFVKGDHNLTIPRAESAIHAIGQLITATSIQQ